MMNKKLNMHGLKKSKKHATHKTHTDSYSAVRDMAAGDWQVPWERGMAVEGVMMKGLGLYVP